VRLCNRSKEKVYIKERESISIVKRGEVHEFMEEQLKKGYIRLLKLPQIVPVFL